MLCIERSFYSNEIKCPSELSLKMLYIELYIENVI